ncbi:MAG TPA: Gfo/Idh/MocA family oxidoreductase [Verrucomicrobiae bacterium]|jgi:predicted dehydrogenase|nr:Gfo/Idh/MocA family oxidoreductase [Verrucomicrobiae bacterium]
MKHDPARGVSRRHFLSAAGVASTLLLLPSRVLGRNGAPSPNSKLNIAGIGVGGQGGSDLGEMTSENIVALCDVDWDHAAHTFKKYPQAKVYKDFREMLDKEKSIDAVVVGTPDHNHAIVSMAAIKQGKHVYCEKPLTHTVREARLLAQAAREAKVATQMGNQGMAFDANRQINEWLADGAIGPVREVHAWSDRPTHKGHLPLWWAQGIERPTDTPAVPSTLDWDLWLGPAPYRPYHPVYAPFRWRGWWDFGSGGLGDMGIHNLAPVFSALKLGAPTSIEASSTPVFPDSVTAAGHVHYQFPARGEMPPVKLHWYDGGLLPERPDELPEGQELDAEDGVIFVGDRGKMLVTGWGGQGVHLSPAALDKSYQRPAPTLARSKNGHYQEWIAACKTGSETRSNFAFSGPLTEAVQLGTVCLRNGGSQLLWDSENMKFTNDRDANQYLHYEYRKGWSL